MSLSYFELLNSNKILNCNMKEVDRILLSKLGAEGQNPKVMLISCADSRVCPNLITSSRPGDLFVVRNIANLVPKYEIDNCSSYSIFAAIQYAVNYLNIKDIVIMGHSKCGGVAALVDNIEHDENNNFICKWLAGAEQTIKKAIIQKDQKHSSIYECCEKASVIESVKNCKSIPFVNDLIQSEKLNVHGWYFNIEKSLLSVWNEKENNFVENV